MKSIWRVWAKRWTLRTGTVALACLLSSMGWVVLYRYVNPPGTLLMVQRYLAANPGAARIKKQWADLDQVSPEAIVAILASEDQRFFTHPGFDTAEIRAALEERRAGGMLRGASTISQQTAKNIFLWNSRSWVRKGLEVYFTGLIELLWGKERILEIYVNTFETGHGLYGIEAAAQEYFGKPASALSAEEGALIAAILPNPLLRSPVQPSDHVLGKQAWILKQVHNLGGRRFLESHGV